MDDDGSRDDVGESSGQCPVAAATAALAAAVDALQAAQLAGLSEPGLIAALDAVERQARRLPSVRDAVVAEVKRRDVATVHGARSTSAWLQSRFRIGLGEARTWLRGADRLTSRTALSGEPLQPVLSAVAAARAAGDLSPAQVKVIDDLDDELPFELADASRREIEQGMVACAQQLAPNDLVRLGQRFLDAIDPDGTEPKSEEAHRRRGITIGPLRDGLARISGHVDAWCHEAILAVLASFADPDPSPSAAANETGTTDEDRAHAPSGEPEPTSADADATDPDSGSTTTSADAGCGCGTGSPKPDAGSADAGCECGAGSPEPDAGSADTGTRVGRAYGADSTEPPGAVDTNATVEQEGPTVPRPEAPAVSQLARQRPLDADRRIRPQRLHDALGRALRRLLREGLVPRRGGTAATILLTVPLSVLEQRTGLVSTTNGGDLPIREVLRRAGEATFIPIVIDRVGNPLYLGRRQRLASPAQRHALHIRDGGCVIPGCATPSQDCQAHHLHDWADGGRTDIDNLCLLCEYHHQRIRPWTLELKYGRIWCTAPFSIDRDQTPQSNVYFRNPAVEALFS